MPRESHISIYRTETASASPSGLTAGELAVNITDKKLWVGDNAGNSILLVSPTVSSGIPLGSPTVTGAVSIDTNRNLFVTPTGHVGFTGSTGDTVVAGNRISVTTTNRVATINAVLPLGSPTVTGSVSVDTNSSLFITATGHIGFTGSVGVTGIGFGVNDRGLTGKINITAGSNITITASGNTITIASGAGSGVASVTGNGAIVVTETSLGDKIVRAKAAGTLMLNLDGSPANIQGTPPNNDSGISGVAVFKRGHFVANSQYGTISIDPNIFPQFSGLGVSGGSGSTDGSVLEFVHLDLTNLPVYSGTFASKSSPLVLMYDADESDYFKTKSVSINDLFVKNYDMFESTTPLQLSAAGQNFAQTKVQFGVVLGNVAPDSTGLIIGSSAHHYIAQNTVSSINGCTGAITVTGTANQIVVTNSCPGFTISLAAGSTGDTVSATASGLIAIRSSQAVSLFNTGVTAVNGLTGFITITGDGGAVRGVENNIIGARLASASVTGVASFGNQFVVSTSGAVGLTSNYVISVNGSTGTITNVAKTNVDNAFTLRQSISDNLATNQVTVGGSSIDFYYGVSENIQVLQSADVPSIVALPGDTGVLALTKNVVASLNGITGARTLTGDGSSIRKWVTGSTEVITARNASLSLTGVASFSNADFVVGSTGHVGLTGTVARKNSDNSFSTIQTFGAGISASGGLTAVGDYFIGSGSGAIRGIPAISYIAIGDESEINNGTQIQIDDTAAAISIKNPNGVIFLGDDSGVNTGNVLEINSSGSLISMYFPEVYTNGYMNADKGYRIGSGAINAQTGTSYTLTGTDNGKIVTFNNGSAVTVTVPAGLVQGYNCTVIQLGGGQVGFTAPAGVTLNSYGNQFKMIGQHGSATVLSYLSNVYNLSGNLIV